MGMEIPGEHRYSFIRVLKGLYGETRKYMIYGFSQNYGPLLVNDGFMTPSNDLRIPKWDPNVGNYPYKGCIRITHLKLAWSFGQFRDQWLRFGIKAKGLGFGAPAHSTFLDERNKSEIRLTGSSYSPVSLANLGK